MEDHGIRRWCVAVCVTLGVLGGSVLADGAVAVRSTSVRPIFVGMNADGPLLIPGVRVGRQVRKMAASGVRSLRVAFPWSAAQPYRQWKDVPAGHAKHFATGPGGVPTSYFETDRIVTVAARYGLRVLPVVTYAPPWDGSAKGNHVQPAHDRPYARYLTALVERYGPDGTFWSAHPGLPKRPVVSWQIWNEPDLNANWDSFPFARSYVALLRVAHRVIVKADPSAQIVLAALTNYGWRDLASVYSVRGSRSLFDTVAANPYTAQPSGVITILKKFREIMAQNGDRAKPLIATEVGWPSGAGKADENFGINTTQRGQARKLSELLPLLATNRHRLHLTGFYYYTWVSTDPRRGDPFQYAGLLHYARSSNRVRPKPAYFAFRRAAFKLEGCGSRGCR